MQDGCQITNERVEEGRCLRFAGVVDEYVNFDAIDVGTNETLIFDLEGVRLINSLGIRGWVAWFKKLRQRSVVVRRASRTVVDQFNVMEGFLPPSAVVESFFVPYHCDACENSDDVLYRHGIEFERASADRPEQLRNPQSVPCAHCHSEMSPDIIEAKYFRFLKYRRS